jgi:hypothetical protein
MKDDCHRWEWTWPGGSIFILRLHSLSIAISEYSTNEIMAVEMARHQQPQPSATFQFRSSPYFVLTTVCIAIFNVSPLRLNDAVAQAERKDRMCFCLVQYVVVPMAC